MLYKLGVDKLMGIALEKVPGGLVSKKPHQVGVMVVPNSLFLVKTSLLGSEQQKRKEDEEEIIDKSSDWALSQGEIVLYG